MRRCLSVIVAALLACLTLAACGGDDGGSFDERVGGDETTVDDSAGVTAKSIAIGVHGPKSGPAASLVADVFTGFELYVDKINADGGVNGRTLEVEVVDDQFTVAGGTAAGKELAQGDVMVAVNLAGAESAVGAQPALERGAIPYLQVALPLAKLEGSKTTFSLGTPLELTASAVPSFAATELDAGTKTVAILSEADDIYQEMVGGVRDNAADAGIEIAAEEVVDGTASSFRPALFKLREAGADVVILVGGLAVPGILRDAKSIGFEPTWTGSGPWTTDFINAVAEGAMEGIQAVRANGGVDAPGFDEFAAAWKADTPPTELGFLGWTHATNIAAMLERLGDDPSRSALVEMLETETEDDPIAASEAQPPLSYTAERHWASDEVLPSTVRDGVWVATGEFTQRFGE